MNFFKLRQLTIVCPECQTIFATYELARTPPITVETPMESDLHRVLPDAQLRASLLATCPSCVHTWWLSSFKEHYYLPQIVPDSPPLEPAKKFAHAVQSGRKTGASLLDRAVLALNGYWCAREQGVDGEKFLRLARAELIQALADKSWAGNRPRYNYILGEVSRLLSEFVEADKCYALVDRDAGLPPELVEKMRIFAASGNNKPIRLPAHIVQTVFIPTGASA